MIWTSFLFSSFISILSKIEKNSWEGKKVLFSMLFGHPKMAKMAKKCPAQIKFASRRSICSSDSLECPILAWDMSKSSLDSCGSNDTLPGPVRPLQGQIWRHESRDNLKSAPCNIPLCSSQMYNTTQFKTYIIEK